ILFYKAIEGRNRLSTIQHAWLGERQSTIKFLDSLRRQRNPIVVEGKCCRRFVSRQYNLFQRLLNRAIWCFLIRERATYVALKEPLPHLTIHPVDVCKPDEAD